MTTHRRAALLAHRPTSSPPPPGPDYPAAVLADTPLAYYRLGEASGTTIVDAGPGGHNGTYYSAKTAAQSLLVSDGTDAATRVPGGVTGASWMSVTEFSIEVILKMNAGQGNTGIVSRFSGGGGLDFLLWFDNVFNRISFRPYNAGGSSIDLNAPTDQKPGDIYHVVATYKSGEANLYINGALVATSAALTGAAHFTAGQALEIGAYGSASHFFDGVLDEVAYYGYVLTSTQVAAHYAAASTVPSTIGAPTDIADCVGWFSAESITGLSDNVTLATWPDLSGNGNDAVATGAPKYRTGTGPGAGPAVDFAGSGNYYTLPNLLSGATSGEVFLSVKSNGSDCGLWGFGQGTNNSDESHYPFSGTVYESWGMATGIRTSYSPSPSITAWRRYNVIASGNEFHALLDGTHQFYNYSSGSAYAPFFHAAPVLGVGRKFAAVDMQFLGSIAAMIVFARKLTNSEREQVAEWLAAHPNGGT